MTTTLLQAASNDNLAMRELLEAGLHRLAQPLTSALWIAETDTAAPELDTLPGKLSHELQRAVGVLQATRLLLEMRPAEDTDADLADILAGVSEAATRECAAVGVRFDSLGGTSGSGVLMPRVLVGQSLQECVRSLLTFDLGDACIKVCLYGDVETSALLITMRLSAPSGCTISELQQQQFRGGFDPFDTPGFNFVSYMPQAPFLARIALATAGARLHARATTAGLEIKIAIPYPDIDQA